MIADEENHATYGASAAFARSRQAICSARSSCAVCRKVPRILTERVLSAHVHVTGYLRSREVEKPVNGKSKKSSAAVKFTAWESCGVSDYVELKRKYALLSAR